MRDGRALACRETNRCARGGRMRARGAIRRPRVEMHNEQIELGAIAYGCYRRAYSVERNYFWGAGALEIELGPVVF